MLSKYLISWGLSLPVHLMKKCIKELIEENEARIRRGIIAYDLFKQLRQQLKEGKISEETKAEFDQYKKDLGYGLLLKKYTSKVVDATDEQIISAAHDTIPPVALLFWSFRIMVACGFLMLFIFAMAFYLTAKRTIMENRWLLWLALFGIPLPWIACEMGWIVAEVGRQPWSIAEILPTYLSTSTRSIGDLYFSLAGFIGFYTLLLVVELYLMFKYARLGPSSLHTGRYHFEKS